MINQDRTPNFRAKGKLYLVRCFSCNRENYAPAVASGVCAWCGWEEGRSVKFKKILKKVNKNHNKSLKRLADGKKENK